jgi:hypothetical protein
MFVPDNPVCHDGIHLAAYLTHRIFGEQKQVLFTHSKVQQFVLGSQIVSCLLSSGNAQLRTRQKRTFITCSSNVR